MSDDKATWWSFLAWPLVGTGLVSVTGLFFFFIAYLNRRGPRSLCQSYGSGGECTIEKGPWLYLILGIALVVTGIVLFIRLRRKIRPRAELDYEGESTMTESTLPSRRPRIPMSENSRRFTSLTAAVWTVVGLIVAISRWSTVEKTSRTFAMLILFLALLGGVGAAIIASRGTRRNTMIFLVVASMYPPSIWRELGWVPLALLLYLIFDALRIASRDKLRSRRRIWFAGLIVVVIMVSSTWYQIHFDSASALGSKRAQRAFQQMTTSISKKEGSPTPWLTPMRAGFATYPDGSKASLWVPKPSPTGNRSNCFYLDQTKKNTAYGFTYFDCIPLKAAVLLQRQHAVVVGFLSDPKTNFVTVTSGGSTAKVPVTFGYFIVPGAISAFPLAKFTITYTDSHQATCEVVDLGAPGSVDAARCTIA